MTPLGNFAEVIALVQFDRKSHMREGKLVHTTGVFHGADAAMVGSIFSILVLLKYLGGSFQ